MTTANSKTQLVRLVFATRLLKSARPGSFFLFDLKMWLAIVLVLGPVNGHKYFMASRNRSHADTGYPKDHTLAYFYVPAWWRIGGPKVFAAFVVVFLAAMVYDSGPVMIPIYLAFTTIYLWMGIEVRDQVWRINNLFPRPLTRKLRFMRFLLLGIAAPFTAVYFVHSAYSFVQALLDLY